MRFVGEREETTLFQPPPAEQRGELRQKLAQKRGVLLRSRGDLPAEPGLPANRTILHQNLRGVLRAPLREEMAHPEPGDAMLLAKVEEPFQTGEVEIIPSRLRIKPDAEQLAGRPFARRPQCRAAGVQSGV